MNIETFLQASFSVLVAAFLLIRMERELRLVRGAIENLRHCSICVLSPWRDALDILDSEAPEAEKEPVTHEIPR